MTRTFCTKTTLLLAIVFFGVCCDQVLADPGQYELQIGAAFAVVPGTEATIPVTLNRSGAEGLRAFDLLFGYDRAFLMFTDVSIGTAIGSSGCAWEYFTWRQESFSGCNGFPCPSGLVRVVALADINNNTAPTCLAPLSFPAEMFRLSFRTTTDQYAACEFLPVRLFWRDCFDNLLVNETNTLRFISHAIYDGYPPVLPINVTIGVDLPTYHGAQEECDVDPDGPGPMSAPGREVDVLNGGIEIVCSEPPSSRGDVNCNGQAYEASDAVLYAMYFTYGLDALNPHVPPECFFSNGDIDGDGYAGSVNDLVTLIRIVIGDAKPTAKASVDAQCTLTRQHDTFSTDTELAAALIVVAGEVVPTLLAKHTSMTWRFDGTNTRILISPSLDTEPIRLTSFDGPFVSVPGDVIAIDVATPDGLSKPEVDLEVIPDQYSLQQNYPNPFNPGTTIAFSLPVAGPVMLEVYNLLGQRVALLRDGPAEAGYHRVEWNGKDDNGAEVASGVYLYRLTADGVVETKKMIMVR